MYRAITLLIVVVWLMLSGFINYAHYLQKQIDRTLSCVKDETSQIEHYYDVNLAGEKTLLLSAVPEIQKEEIWNTSSLKNEMIEFFPNFIKMSTLVNERVVDNGLFKEKLLTKIRNTEERYIGGVITGQSAKKTLSSF